MMGRRDGRTWTLLAAFLAAGAILLWWSAGVVAQSTDEAQVAPVVVVELPPGNIQGTITDADGVTLPWSIAITLTDAATGLEVSSTTTAADGAYVLENVPPGAYTLRVGQPGIAIALETTEGADAVPLDVVIASLMVSPPPSGVPDWVEALPLPATAVSSEGGITLLATWGSYAGEGSGEGVEPVTSSRRPPGPPGPPPFPGPPPWPPGPPPGPPGPPPYPPPWISPTTP